MFAFLYNIPMCTKALIDLILSKAMGETATAGKRQCTRGTETVILGCHKTKRWMFPTPTLTLLLLSVGILTFIIFTLLSIIDLKKPRDPGPRIIEDHRYRLLQDLETRVGVMGNGGFPESSKADNLLLWEIASVLATLHDLEA